MTVYPVLLLLGSTVCEFTATLNANSVILVTLIRLIINLFVESRETYLAFIKTSYQLI